MCFGVNCPFKKTTLALLHDHSCSSGVKRKGGKEDGCQSLTTASVTAALLMCHHPSVTTAVTSPCHRQSAQRGVPRMSSVSACMLPAVEPLSCSVVSASVMLIGNVLHSFITDKQRAALFKTLSSASSTSYTARAAHAPNRRCPQKHFNEIGLLQHRIRAEMVLNYLSEQLGEVCFMKKTCAKEN